MQIVCTWHVSLTRYWIVMSMEGITLLFFFIRVCTESFTHIKKGFCKRHFTRIWIRICLRVNGKFLDLRLLNGHLVRMQFRWLICIRFCHWNYIVGNSYLGRILGLVLSAWWDIRNRCLPSRGIDPTSFIHHLLLLLCEVIWICKLLLMMLCLAARACIRYIWLQNRFFQSIMDR
jgi:hypothetical protein